MYSYNRYTTEQLARRWYDKRLVQNVLGKYASSFMLKREKGIYNTCWCSDSMEPCLGLNNGYYVGEKAIRGYFDAISENTDTKSRLMQKLFPEYLEKRGDAEIHGVGEETLYPTVSGVVEIADDAETAKGCWLCLGADTSIGTAGPVTRWQYGCIGVDFIRENGEWRIWHLKHIIDNNCLQGKNWTEPVEEYEDLPDFAELKGLTLPEPTVLVEVHKTYYVGRPFTPLLPTPDPYTTFTDTFSYGM